MPGYELYGPEERQAMLDWFDASGGVMFAHGFEARRNGVFKVREFERAVARTIGCSHAQAVSSGTAALLVALRALGIRPGDEVITQAFTFVATVEAILAAGAVPVITEVDESLTMDPDDLRRRLTPRTRAIIPVHMAGAAAPMEAILGLAHARRIPVLEDACQAFGGTYHGRALGTLGEIGVYSFDFAKNITTGEGGMVVTQDHGLYERARAFHDHGHEYSPQRPRGQDTRHAPGFNFRMTEVQAVLGLTQLQKLPTILSRQRAHYAALKAGLEDCAVQWRRLHDAEGAIGDTLIFFVDSVPQAQALAAALACRGVGTKNLPDALGWHFAGTWHHLFQGVSGLERPETLWPRTSDLLHRAIALPVTVVMSDGQMAEQIASVRAAMREAGLAQRAPVEGHAR